MNKFFLVLGFSLSTTGYAADWTPVFKKFENECDTSHPALQALNNRFIDLKVTAIETKVVPHQLARAGKYAGVPSVYRKDMQPAVARTVQLNEDSYLGYTEIYVGLSNASAYGLPLAGYSQYSGGENGVYGHIVYFKPMTKQSFNRLKKIRFKAEQEMGFQGEIGKTAKGQVYLICDLST